MRVGMIFGTFDCIHPGHRSAIRQSINKCDHLVIVVAQDNTVMELKGRFPLKRLSERIKDLEKEFPSTSVVQGDSILGTGLVFSRFKPTIVFIGYDQEKLIPWIQQNKLKYRILEPSEPDIYHSSKLNTYENNSTVSVKSTKLSSKSKENKRDSNIERN